MWIAPTIASVLASIFAVAVVLRILVVVFVNIGALIHIVTLGNVIIAPTYAREVAMVHAEIHVNLLR